MQKRTPLEKKLAKQHPKLDAAAIAAMAKSIEAELAKVHPDVLDDFAKEDKPAATSLVALADLVLCAPFSTLLSIDADTYESIKADMQVNGFDPTQPAHLWERHDGLIVVDGCTRIKAAGEVGVTHIPAFTHQFATEKEALEFAFKCQFNRRNLKDGELVRLVAAYDAKVKPGSNQPRGQDGSFAPKASGDADGKTAKRTAEKLGVSTTKIERVRRVIKNADPATKRDLADNKITLHTALKRVAKAQEAQVAADNDTERPEASGSPNDNPSGWFPFEPISGSDVAVASWDPVVRISPALSADPTASPDDGQPTYTLDETRLEIEFPAKVLKALPNRRVLVSAKVDLFASEVPAKAVRRTLQAAAAAKNFVFLFTTSNPERLQEFSWEENTFAGVSIFEQRDVEPAETALAKLENMPKWLVVEQLTMELTFQHLDQLDWLVVRVGAGVPGATMDSHAMRSLLQQAWAADCPVLFEQGITYRPTDPPKAHGEKPKTSRKVAKKSEGKTHE